MPYLRYSRDKRGYEHTYVLHGARSGGRPRLLYWFRTPPHVAVGRDALDEEAITAIETSNPDLTFDWEQMRRDRPKPPPPRPSGGGGPGPRGRRGGERGGRRRSAERTPAKSSAAPPDEIAAAPPADATPAEATVPPSDDATEAPVGPAAPAPSAVTPASDAPAVSGAHPVAALLGDAALGRLRERFATLETRLADSDATGAMRDQLADRIGALDPDTWHAGEEVVVRLERFDAEAADIEAVLDNV